MLMLMQFLCKKIQCTFLLLQLHSTEPSHFRFTPWQPLGTLRAVTSKWALPGRQIAGVDRTRHNSIVHTPGGYGERAAKWAASRHETDGEVWLARWTSLTLLQLKATWWLEPARFISSAFQKLWKPMWVWAGRKTFPQGQQVTNVPRFHWLLSKRALIDIRNIHLLLSFEPGQGTTVNVHWLARMHISLYTQMRNWRRSQSFGIFRG